MIRLLILICIILFFAWLISSLFFGDKKELNRKLVFPKSSLFLILLIVVLLAFWVLPRLGVNPLLLIQKILPLLSSIRNIIPF
tara:strand:- start:201 stop:449 length:249 start_codon:yes stop_codon:yes gene_type:complete